MTLISKVLWMQFNPETKTKSYTKEDMNDKMSKNVISY